jgi:uncharacterized protein YbjT (DUF2867 family)
MKNVIITGSNGMIGGLILSYCLGRNDVSKVTSIVRRKSGIDHPKLVEIIHSDFLDYSSIPEHFKNQDIAFYCIGVYTGQVPKDEFRKITVDYTEAFAKTLRTNSVKTTFCFLSGAGADPSGKSSMMFARDKGVAENILMSLKFDQTYIFRPAYIYPVTPRKEPNFSYKLFRFLYKPLLSWIYPNGSVTSENLAKAMVKVGFEGAPKVVLENKDIRELKNTPPINQTVPQKIIAGLPYPIKKEIRFGENRVVILDVPVKSTYNRNVVCLNKHDRKIWQIKELPLYPGHAKQCPYTEIEFIDGKLKLWNWCSFCFVVDPGTGEVIERIETR